MQRSLILMLLVVVVVAIVLPLFLVAPRLLLDRCHRRYQYRFSCGSYSNIPAVLAIGSMCISIIAIILTVVIDVGIVVVIAIIKHLGLWFSKACHPSPWPRAPDA